MYSHSVHLFFISIRMEGDIGKYTEEGKAVGSCGDGRNMKNCY
jgi:hypothetical protein